MSIMPAICTNCGATLAIKDNSKKVKCSYCDTVFLIDPYNNRSLDNIKQNTNCDETVIMSGDLSNFICRGGILEKYVGIDENVLIPEGIITIGEGAFIGSLVKTIRFSASVKQICTNAFLASKFLRHIEGLENVVDIKDVAFAECRSLIIDSLEEAQFIGERAFYNCHSIKILKMPKLMDIGDNAFENCLNLSEIQISESSYMEMDGKECFKGCCNLDTVMVGNKVVDMPDGIYQRSYRVFIGSGFCEKALHNYHITYQKQKNDKLETIRKEQGVCLFCGGKFDRGIIKKCKKCGKIKSY